MKKEKTVNDDRITYRQLGQLIDGRDRPAAHAIDTAARGVNATENAIRQLTAMIRATLDQIEQRLDHGLSLNELGELQRMPADLDRAIALRQHHWQVLGALLTETQITSLQPAPPRTPATSQSGDQVAIGPTPPGCSQTDRHRTTPRVPRG
jgi:flagellar biosynthesis chaperone FliJ